LEAQHRLFRLLPEFLALLPFREIQARHQLRQALLVSRLAILIEPPDYLLLIFAVFSHAANVSRGRHPHNRTIFTDRHVFRRRCETQRMKPEFSFVTARIGKHLSAGSSRVRLLPARPAPLFRPALSPRRLNRLTTPRARRSGIVLSGTPDC